MIAKKKKVNNVKNEVRMLKGNKEIYERVKKITYVKKKNSILWSLKTNRLI